MDELSCLVLSDKGWFRFISPAEQFIHSWKPPKWATEDQAHWTMIFWGYTINSPYPTTSGPASSMSYLAFFMSSSTHPTHKNPPAPIPRSSSSHSRPFSTHPAPTPPSFATDSSLWKHMKFNVLWKCICRSRSWPSHTSTLVMWLLLVPHQDALFQQSYHASLDTLMKLSGGWKVYTDDISSWI